MKLSATTTFNIYLFIAILTFGYTTSGLDDRTYKDCNNKEQAQFIAVLAAPMWPLYWMHKGFSWARSVKVTVK